MTKEMRALLDNLGAVAAFAVVFYFVVFCL